MVFIQNKQNNKYNHKKIAAIGVEEMMALASVGTWWSGRRRWAAHHLGRQTKVVGVAAYGRKKKHKENKRKTCRRGGGD
jgi:hypothetical protein